jgi:hypothetical protein
MQVDKQKAQFFTLELSSATIEEGFSIAAHSDSSKFKLLLFERTPEGAWELLTQVTSPESEIMLAASLCCEERAEGA